MLRVFLISARQLSLNIEEQVPSSFLVFLTTDELSVATAMMHPVYGVLAASERLSSGLRSCQYDAIKVAHISYDVFSPRVCHV